MIFLISPAFSCVLVEPCQKSRSPGALLQRKKKKSTFKIQLFYTKLRRNPVFYPHVSHPVTRICPKQWAAE